MDLAAAVLVGLRREFGLLGTLSTRRVGEAVERALQATGLPEAAAAYVRARGELQRRREAMRVTAGPSSWPQPPVHRVVRASNSGPVPGDDPSGPTRSGPAHPGSV
jgi:hypothetical protein